LTGLKPCALFVVGLCRGIIPRSFRHIFDSINGLGKDKEYLVRASFLEIYNEDIRDLLSKNPSNKLELKESVDTGEENESQPT
jgi:hypothetical protein